MFEKIIVTVLYVQLLSVSESCDRVTLAVTTVTGTPSLSYRLTQSVAVSNTRYTVVTLSSYTTSMISSLVADFRITQLMSQQRNIGLTSLGSRNTSEH